MNIVWKPRSVGRTDLFGTDTFDYHRYALRLCMKKAFLRFSVQEGIKTLIRNRT